MPIIFYTMATTEQEPEYIFESSWEVCNMVGGIYTVLSTRAATLVKKHSDKLIFIGPDVWVEHESPFFREDTSLLRELAVYITASYGLHIRVGRWMVPGNPIAILVDFYPLLNQKDEIYGKVWETARVNSLGAYGDYDESSMFGYASGMIIDAYLKCYSIPTSTCVAAHFNEWMTSFGLFYLRKHQPGVATLFTTHATSIGRSIAGNQKPLYNYLNEYNGDQMAGELNMVSKHSTEKQAAHLADCFTTVSKITALECSQLLDKDPDIITPNGFEDDFVPGGKEFTRQRSEARKLLRKVAETLIGEQLHDDALFVGTAGRYEYKNKGLDVFIESLKHLNDYRASNRQVVAFIMVPAWIRGHRADLANSLQHNYPLHAYNRLSTHELHDYQGDPVIGALNWFHLHNQPGDRVKVVFVPAYLNGKDGIFNKSYYELLIGLDLTVFASYYEPWGYTPLESVAFHVPTITTDLSGFGEWVSDLPQHVRTGVGIIHRSDYNSHEVAIELAAMINDFLAENETSIASIRKKAAAIAQKALWKHFIHFYEKAYSIALRNAQTRI